MKICFFLLKFPVASETFVINQIVSFINMGCDVKIISLQVGDVDNAHELFFEYNLGEKTNYLINEPQGKIKKLLFRFLLTLKGIGKIDTWKAMNFSKYGVDSLKLMLPAICGAGKNQVCSDVILSHFGQAGVLAYKLRDLGLLSGKIATVFHGLDISRKDILEKNKTEYKNLFFYGDLMLPISNLWAQRLMELGCPSNKIAVSHMGIDTKKFSFHGAIKNTEVLKVVSVARLTEKKGLHIAIKAFRELKTRGIYFQYKIIGLGPLESYLSSLIRDNDLEDEIKLLGFKPNQEIKKILDDANIFLLPSVTGSDGDMEGIPVALMEAMAVGIPVVSTIHSGIPELIDDGVTGWLVPENNPTALADKIETVMSLGSHDIMRVLEQARVKVESDFEQEKIYSELKELLEGL